MFNLFWTFRPLFKKTKQLETLFPLLLLLRSFFLCLFVFLLNVQYHLTSICCPFMFRCTSLTPGPSCDRFKLHIPYAGETLKCKYHSLMKAALHQQDFILFMIDGFLLTILLDFVRIGLLTLFKYD